VSSSVGGVRILCPCTGVWHLTFAVLFGCPLGTCCKLELKTVNFLILAFHSVKEQMRNEEFWPVMPVLKGR